MGARAKRLALLVLIAAAAACGPSAATGGAGAGASERAGDQAGEASRASSDVARVHRARCGACHVRVEPGERTRAQLEDALARHRPRVRLSEPDWAKMVDYLAAPPASARMR